MRTTHIEFRTIEDSRRILPIETLVLCQSPGPGATEVGGPGAMGFDTHGTIDGIVSRLNSDIHERVILLPETT